MKTLFALFSTIALVACSPNSSENPEHIIAAKLIQVAARCVAFHRTVFALNAKPDSPTTLIINLRSNEARAIGALIALKRVLGVKGPELEKSSQDDVSALAQDEEIKNGAAEYTMNGMHTYSDTPDRFCKPLFGHD